MENGFFKWMWRYNGLAIAIAVTTVLDFLGWELSNRRCALKMTEQTTG